MTSTDDRRYMARAISLGRRGLYTTDPNPRVGCVLVRGGRIVGEGWHVRAGLPHAEVNAIAQAGSAAQGSTAYVSLEPCCHHGRTGPCTKALGEAGVSRVIAAMLDPNPRVSGQGFEALKAQGIAVDCGLLQEQAEQLNPGFLMRMRRARPFVRCKLAMSLDGRTAMSSGESKWITGPSARRDVQRLRARSSAIVTGIGTVLKDDPSLNVRWAELGDPGAAEETAWRQPLRVVLDPLLETPVGAKLLGLPGRTVIATTGAETTETKRRLAKLGAEVHALPGSGDTVDLHGLMALLAELEVNEVLLESGATLSGAMLQAGLVDELIVYMAPALMGADARGLFVLPGLEKMAHRIPLEITQVRKVGRDWRITAKAS